MVRQLAQGFAAAGRQGRRGGGGGYRAVGGRSPHEGRTDLGLQRRRTHQSAGGRAIGSDEDPRGRRPRRVEDQAGARRGLSNRHRSGTAIEMSVAAGGEFSVTKAWRRGGPEGSRRTS